MLVHEIWLSFILYHLKESLELKCAILPFELAPNKKYSELHLVNPHSLKQITHGHLNVTTTIANRCYRPGPNKYFISTTRVTFSTKLLHPDPIESVARLRQQHLKCGPKASLSGECHRTVI